MLSGTVYDPPEYSGFGMYPTDRTLKNYYGQASYGQVDVIKLNMPSALGGTTLPHSCEYY